MLHGDFAYVCMYVNNTTGIELLQPVGMALLHCTCSRTKSVHYDSLVSHRKIRRGTRLAVRGSHSAERQQRLGRLRAQQPRRVVVRSRGDISGRFTDNR